MRSNSPITTATNVDTKLTQKSSLSKNKTQINNKNQNRICNDFYNGFNQIISVTSNYQVNIFDFILLSHRYV
jgi:hypothetical protein